MPFADQVPVNNPHSKMQWHKWVVLIAESTGSALHAVRPPNFHITPDVDAISSHSHERLHDVGKFLFPWDCVVGPGELQQL